jgi:hypothetical protein
VITKEADKILKYKDLTIELHCMSNVKTGVIPVIIGATGTILKSLRKYVSIIPGNLEIKELQKNTILGTAHIFRKVLMHKYIRANAAASDIGVINSSDRIGATFCCLGTWFVSGIYV